MTKEDLLFNFQNSIMYDQLVVVGESWLCYYYIKGMDKLKQLYFDKACDLDIEGLYIEQDGDYVLNEEVYNKLSITDIDSDVQEVLTGEEIVDRIEDYDEEGEYYTVRVAINSGWYHLKVLKCLFN